MTETANINDTANMTSMNEGFLSCLDCLNPEQRQAVVHEGTPLLILAGAGSGKTRVITTKIAYLIAEKGIDPSSILAVTFTKKAAAEMRERAIALERSASKAKLCTFHSFGAWFLRLYGAAAERNLSANFTVYDDNDSAALIAASVERLGKDKTGARALARHIALAKDYCLSPDDDLSEIVNSWEVEEFRNDYRTYMRHLDATGNVDFGDLIMLPALMLESNEGLTERMRRRFRVVMVDEYQDSNVAQFRLLKALVGDARETYVCVVGDDDQSIYKFRGAEVSNILNFAKVFPDTQEITLGRNYRSTSQILSIASTVVQNNTGRIDKVLTAERGEGEKPVLVFLNDQWEEATYCADIIETSINAAAGKPPAHYRDWAILYRSNAQSRAFETEFMRRKLPYVIVGTLKFYEREEVKDAIAILSLVSNGRDEVSFRRVVNKPARGVGAKSLNAFINDANASGMDLIEAASKVSSSGGAIIVSKKVATGLHEFCNAVNEVKAALDGSAHLSFAVEKAITLSGLMEHYTKKDMEDNGEKGSSHVANMRELAASSFRYECTLKGLTAFLDDIALSEATSQTVGQAVLTTEQGGAMPAMPDAVTLITVHNTKGLEFPHVILTGVEMGIWPHGTEDAEELEEERRLFYVGVTRARDTLCITNCSVRYLYGHETRVTPSRFIYEAAKAEEDVFDVIDRRPPLMSDISRTMGKQNAEGMGIAPAMVRGVRVYNDDYGYGHVVKREEKNGEVVVTVQFENGGAKRFMPQYQMSILSIVE